MNGEVLKAQLLKLEPTLVEVAKKLQVTKQSLNQTLSASDIKTGFVEQLAAVYERPISYFFCEHAKIDDHSDDHSAHDHSKTEHYEGVDAAIVAKLQIAEERIKLLEARLVDKDALLASKDETITSQKAEIESMCKTMDYLMGQK
nr:hypothetical protein [Bacteroides acidifaciens]